MYQRINTWGKMDLRILIIFGNQSNISSGEGKKENRKNLLSSRRRIRKAGRREEVQSVESNEFTIDIDY